MYQVELVNGMFLTVTCKLDANTATTVADRAMASRNAAPSVGKADRLAAVYPLGCRGTAASRECVFFPSWFTQAELQMQCVLWCPSNGAGATTG